MVNSWEWQYPPYEVGDLHGVWGIPVDDVYAVGVNGTILHYDGSNWGGFK